MSGFGIGAMELVILLGLALFGLIVSGVIFFAIYTVLQSRNRDSDDPYGRADK